MLGPRRSRLAWFFLSGAVTILTAPATRADDPIERALRAPILGPHQSLAEVRDYTESAVPAMPTVTTAEAWQAQAKRTRADVLDRVVFRGQAAQDWRKAKGRVEWLETLEGGKGYRIRKLRYEALPGLWIPALLYEPEKLDGKVPVSLNVNGHDGKGKAADYKQIRCINMAKRGMLALNIEWLGMGQLQGPGYGHYLMNQLDLCGTSGLAPFYLDMLRGLDVLLAHPNADPKRVLVTGLSGGGWQTITFSALEERVTMSVPVAGYSSFKTRAHHPSDLGDSEQTPNDMALYADYTHYTAMLAPRPSLLVFNAKDNCCFRADHALPPLLDAAKPIFDVLDAGDRLRSHVNNDPGDHNYGQDNRQALYGMLRDFFGTGDAQEIDSESEVQSADALKVELPSDNLNFTKLATKLAQDLPRQPTLPATGDLVAWRAKKIEELRQVVRAANWSVDAETVGTTNEDGLERTLHKLKIGATWTVPAVELSRTKDGERRSSTVSIVVADGGRASTASIVRERLEAGDRVLAVDPFYFGESKIAERDHLYALLVAAVGSRPLGVQASQLAAVARFVKTERRASTVRLIADGPRMGVIAAVTSALEPNAVDCLELRQPLGSLKELIEQGTDVSRMPELLCFGLLEACDARQLLALSAPRPIEVKQAGDRARKEFTGLDGWAKAVGGSFSIQGP